ncbi:hypothetical protein [Craterilacuibacter sp. RT1T]|uniref:hypothetical protein n=1 Tax=Craterilacuibacter sp. RT1T TaxID=2942211 RepID=UPI0020BE3869|nr:hypothetical protein [Craterilacuibacter sp. RT1T]MCL6262804.1 hypothetical protein [Craterilacuibacter sp. RT1T]
MSKIIINGHNFVKSLLDGQARGDEFVQAINAYLSYLAEQAEMSGITLEVENGNQTPEVYRITDEADSADFSAAQDFMQHRVKDFWAWHGRTQG